MRPRFRIRKLVGLRPRHQALCKFGADPRVLGQRENETASKDGLAAMLGEGIYTSYLAFILEYLLQTCVGGLRWRTFMGVVNPAGVCLLH
jgi:hypothetical protein